MISPSTSVAVIQCQEAIAANDHINECDAFAICTKIPTDVKSYISLVFLRTLSNTRTVLVEEKSRG